MYNFVSLYSGCGGMDVGFIQAGMKCLAAFDIDGAAIANYQHNIGLHIHEEDLSHPSENSLNIISKADVIVAGPPCQGFSTAGKNDPNDHRNNHLINTINIAIKCKPKAIIIENVKGLLGARYKFYWEKSLHLLRDAGYYVSWKIHNSAHYGVAQRRQRVFIIATLNKIELNFKKTDYAMTLGQVLENIVDKVNHNPRFLPENSERKLISAHIKQGQKLSNVRGGDRAIHTWNIPEVYGEVTIREKGFLNQLIKIRRQVRVRDHGDADPMSYDLLCKNFDFPITKIINSLIQKKYLRKVSNQYDLTNAFNGKYRRLKWDEPSLTVDTRFGQPRYFLHPIEDRGFTIREAARIQGFSDNYEFLGSESDIYRIIGNAVPIPMAQAIAEAVIEKLE